MHIVLKFSAISLYIFLIGLFEVKQFPIFSHFRGSNYNLIKHNCNTFSEDLCQFLCGTSIPKYILDLPQEVLSTPLGQRLASIIGEKRDTDASPFHNCIPIICNAIVQCFSPFTERIGANNGEANGSNGTFSFEPQITARESSPGFDELNNEIEEARLQSLELERSRNAIKEKIAKKEKKKEKKKKRNGSQSDPDSPYHSNSGAMSEVEAVELNGAASHAIPSEMLPSEQALEDEAKDRQAEEERRKNREPPIVFKDIDVSAI